MSHYFLYIRVQILHTALLLSAFSFFLVTKDFTSTPADASFIASAHFDS